jgi:DNA-binding response OmpR family regulator
MTRRYEGAGIGLSIAKNIIEAHGGAIELKSELNKGSAFTIALPRSLFSSNLPANYQDSMAETLALVVADDRDFRNAIASILTRCGCQVTTLGKGYECIRTAREVSPDLIVLDEALADLSGISTAFKLKEDPNTNALHVLILASSGAAPLSPMPDTAHAAHFMAKPFGAPELIAEVRRLLFDETPPAPVTSDESLVTPKAVPHVLVIDHDTDVLEWMESALRHRQIPCACAADPESGMKLALHAPPDVVFLDVDTLDEDGASALRLFHDVDATKNVPVYAMTARPPHGREANGAAGILRKPFTIRDLETIVWSNAPRDV